MAAVKPRPLPILSACSLLLCVATCVMWIQSNRSGAGTIWTSAAGVFFFQWHRGVFVMCRAKPIYAHAYDSKKQSHLAYSGDSPIYYADSYGAPWSKHSRWGKVRFNLARFKYASGERGGGLEQWAAVPCWAVVGLTFILPFLSVSRFL